MPQPSGLIARIGQFLGVVEKAGAHRREIGEKVASAKSDRE